MYHRVTTHLKGKEEVLQMFVQAASSLDSTPMNSSAWVNSKFGEVQ